IGGSFGVAAFGSIFANQLTASLDGKLPAQIAGNFSGGGGGEGLDPKKLAELPDKFLTIVTGGVTDAITTVFVWTIPFAALGFLVAWFIKEVPLRGSTPPEKKEPLQAEAEAEATVGV